MIYAAICFTDTYGDMSPKDKRDLESNVAYSLLSALYKKIYSQTCKEIVKDSYGKPRFVDKGVPEFNVSHTDGAVLVALDTDSCPIGVDIQIKVKEEKCERIEKRFPYVNSIKEGMPISELELFLAKQVDGKYVFDKLYPSLSLDEKGFIFKWTLAEALLKAHGEGFCASELLGKINDHRSVSFSPKEDLIASIVSLKKP